MGHGQTLSPYTHLSHTWMKYNGKSSFRGSHSVKMIIIIVLLVTEKPVQVKLTMIWPTCSFVQFNIFTYECEVVAYIFVAWGRKKRSRRWKTIITDWRVTPPEIWLWEWRIYLYTYILSRIWRMNGLCSRHLFDIHLNQELIFYPHWSITNPRKNLALIGEEFR